MPHSNLNLNPGIATPTPEEVRSDSDRSSTAIKIAAVGDVFRGLGEAFGGPRAGPSASAALRKERATEERRKQEQLVFEQQQFVSKMSNLGTFMDLRKNIPKSRQADFDKNAISFIGDTDKRFGELYHFATENAGNTEIIGDLLGGGFEQDPVLQSQLANLGPNGFIDWTLGTGKEYIEQLKTQKFGPSAKAKIGAIVSDLKSNLPSNLFNKITKDGLTTVGEIDVINAHLSKEENSLALTDSELDFIKSADGINTLQGMGIVSNKLSEALIETKRKEQIKAQFKDPKAPTDRTNTIGPVFNTETGRQSGILVEDKASGKFHVEAFDGSTRALDPSTEVVTRRVELKPGDLGTKQEITALNAMTVSTDTFFQITDKVVDLLEENPQALGNTAAAARFASGVKAQVENAANFVGADFDVSDDPSNYEGIWKELGIAGKENAALQSYMTSLAFAATAAQGLGQKNIDSEKEMRRILRQVGANAQSVPEFISAVSAFADTLRFRLENTAKILDKDVPTNHLVTPKERQEMDTLQREIDAMNKALNE